MWTSRTASDVWIGAAYGAWAGHTIAMRNEERRRGFPQAKWSEVLGRPNRSWHIVPAIGRGLVGLTVQTTE